MSYAEQSLRGFIQKEQEFGVNRLMSALSPQTQEAIRKELLSTVTCMLRLRLIEHRKLIAQATNVMHQVAEIRELEELSTRQNAGWGNW